MKYVITEREQEAAVAIIRPAWTPTVYKLLLSAVSPMVETNQICVCVCVWTQIRGFKSHFINTNGGFSLLAVFDPLEQARMIF